MRNLFIIPMVLVCGVAATSERSCPVPAERLPESLKLLDATWERARDLAPNWQVYAKDYRTRSKFDVYGQAAALIFTSGVDADKVLVNLNETNNVQPSVFADSDKDDFARLGQAAMFRGRPVLEALLYVKALAKELAKIKTKEDFSWTERDLNRVAATGFLLNKNIGELVQLTQDVKSAGGLPVDFTGSVSMIVEASLISGVPVTGVLERLKEVEKEIGDVEGWSDVDTYIVLRAALLGNVTGHQAGEMLATMINKVTQATRDWEDASFMNWAETMLIGSAVPWSTRSYAKVLAALIVSGQLDGNVGADTILKLQKIEILAPDWPDPDYATAAAAAIIGPACAYPNLDPKRFW